MTITLTAPADLEPVLDHHEIAVIRAVCRECGSALYAEATGRLAEHPHGWLSAYQTVSTWASEHHVSCWDSRAVTIEHGRTAALDWYRFTDVCLAEVSPGVYLLGGDAR